MFIEHSESCSEFVKFFEKTGVRRSTAAKPSGIENAATEIGAKWHAGLNNMDG